MGEAKSDASRVVLRRTILDHVTPERYVGQTRQRLRFSEIEDAYLKDPLIYRGVNKKSRDMLKKWHGFAPALSSAAAPDPKIVDVLTAWARRVNLRGTMRKAVSDVILYGDAYIEKVWDGDTAPTNEEPTVRGPPAKLAVVNPTTIRPVRDVEPNSPTLGDVLYFEQVVMGAKVDNQTEEPDMKPNGVRFHPSRIEWIQFYDIGDDVRGVGAVEAAYLNVLSKIKSDISLGEILSWHAKGFYVLNIEEGTDEDVDEGFALLRESREKGVNEFAGTERHQFDIKTPAQIDPTGILTSFFINYAGALDMPKDMLIGASAGAVSGSQTNLRDYYEDTQAMVEELTPVVENLYAAALGLGAREDLSVIPTWNKLYVDEKTEADTLFQNAQAASVAWRDEVITKNEYRARLGLPPVPGGDVFFEPAPPPDVPPAEGDPKAELGWREYTGK